MRNFLCLLNIMNRTFQVGCDRSSGLMDICCKRGFEILLCDCLYLPYKNNSIDVVISIAVIHHLTTRERRKRAISEMIRVLRPNGKCLIYVWAKEQCKDSTQSSYLKYDSSKRTKANDINYEISENIAEYQLTLPVHENKTNFIHSDMLVPWKKKGGEQLLRYYHVFQENELEKLCMEIPAALIKKVYYDEGNWCAILEKYI